MAKSRKSRTIDRTADCTIRAVVHLTGLGYYEAERKMRRTGYRPGEGATFPCTVAFLWEHFGSRPGIYANRFSTLSQVREESGRWLVFLKDRTDVHAVAVIDGKVYNRAGFDDGSPVTMVADLGPAEDQQW